MTKLLTREKSFMIITADIHSHTTYSDGKNSPREMICAAIDKGLKTFGITDHAHMITPVTWMMPYDKTDEYISVINDLKIEFKDRIKVLCGIEYDYISDIDLYNYDYVIGSVHYIEKDGNYYSIDHTKDCMTDAIRDHFGGNPYHYCEQYFAQLSSLASNPNISIIGHFDLVEKYNESGIIFDRNDSRYIKAAVAAMEKLNSAGKVFEINTGAMSRVGRSVPYPSEYLLRTLKEMGGKIIFSSDAHSSSTIAFAFDRVVDLVERCGFSDYERLC